MSVKRTNLSHSRQLFNDIYSVVAGGHSVAYTVLVWSRLNTPVELSIPLYHSRHNDRDRQYECDREIKSLLACLFLSFFDE